MTPRMYRHRNNYFGVFLTNGIKYDRSHIRFSNLSWLTDRRILMDGPGIQVYIFGWLLKFGWFTKIQKI